MKINVKEAFTGEVWQWHQDFSTHHHDDGAPEPLALNLHVFLDDVNEFNGPLYFIRGSHKLGPSATRHDTTTTSYPLWVIPSDVVRVAAEQGDLVSAKGAAGTALNKRADHFHHRDLTPVQALADDCLTEVATESV